MPVRKVCLVYFGGYNPSYTRVRTTLLGLRENDIRVEECRSISRSTILRLLILTFKYLTLPVRPDAILVCEAGQAYVFVARFLAWLSGVPLFFDAFLSYYHVNVKNAKLVPLNSWRARYFYYLDRWSCLLVDRVFLDTEEHADYFAREFRLPRQKLFAIPLGSDETIFNPELNLTLSDGKFRIFLVASFYPIHGVEYVIQAAKILNNHPDITFTIAGEGLMRPKIERMIFDWNLKNIILLPHLTPETVAEQMRRADICLGQFSNTEQAQLVFPAKVYDSLCMGKPVISGFSKAVQHFLEDEKQILLVPTANASALAEAILKLKNDPVLRTKIGQAGRALFQKTFSHQITGKQLIDSIIDLLEK